MHDRNGYRRRCVGCCWHSFCVACLVARDAEAIRLGVHPRKQCRRVSNIGKPRCKRAAVLGDPDSIIRDS